LIEIHLLSAVLAFAARAEVVAMAMWLVLGRMA
jgi:hypothetical protein